MKRISLNLKKAEAKLQVETLDDLWYLSNIIDIGDFVKGKTLRKIKLGKEGERSTKVTKKQIFIELKVEKIEFHPYSNILRVSGKITQGPDDIALGSYHTFNVEPNSILTIKKESWLKYQLDKLNESFQAKVPPILICIFDREDAYFALSKKYGYQILSSISGEVQKKDERVKPKGSFFQEIINLLTEYSNRYKISNIILASPAFWKEDLMKLVKDQSLKKKIVLATCSSVSEPAINEVLRRPEVQTVLSKDRIAKEVNLVEDLLQEISKDGLSTYGAKQTQSAVELGAVKTLLITDKYIKDAREKNTYGKLEILLKTVESVNGSVHIISTDHDAGKKLHGLGGIAAIL
ncbi:mRNA surveillance protein pelota, partial [Candidatus Woesearchaeota archaeon]|nr:mRNA surveillance protein pelota [Candidatus Woesearchaeota archaeon]